MIWVTTTGIGDHDGKWRWHDGGGGGKFDGRGAGDYDEGGSGVIGTVISEDKV